MKCPECGLDNPAAYVKCECGYDFKAAPAPPVWKVVILFALAGFISGCVHAVFVLQGNVVTPFLFQGILFAFLIVPLSDFVPRWWGLSFPGKFGRSLGLVSLAPLLGYMTYLVLGLIGEALGLHNGYDRFFLPVLLMLSAVVTAFILSKALRASTGRWDRRTFVLLSIGLTILTWGCYVCSSVVPKSSNRLLEIPELD